MRCLILGATGQIGSHLWQACQNRGYAHLGTWYRQSHPDAVPLDLRDAEAVYDLIADYQPEVTFLAAGINSPGYAEQAPVETAAINVAGSKTVVQAVAQHGGRLVFFSSDAVFGDCLTARREEDPTVPRGEFVRGKLDMEKAIRQELPDRHLIIRTGWLYGPDERHGGMLGRLLRQLDRKQQLPVATDRFGQPCYTPDLAAAVLELALREQTGTFHLVGPEKQSEASFARLVCHLFGYDVDQLAGMPADQLDDSDPLPKRIWLDRFKMRTVLGSKAIRSPSEGLRACRAMLSSQRPMARAA